MTRRALVAAAIGSTLMLSACGTHGPLPSAGGDDDFEMSMIAQIENLRSITIWRITAREVQRHPEEGIVAFARRNRLRWAFSVDGDSRTDSTHLVLAPGAPPAAAETAVVRLVEAATGRRVEATWHQVDADTWTATATYAG